MTTYSPSRQRSLDTLLSLISDCKDFRNPEKVAYSMQEIIFLVYCASLSHCESYYEIVDFGEDKLSFLRRYLPYKSGIPSHDTINTFLSAFSVQAFEQLLISWSTYDLNLPSGSHIAVDGKRIARSVTIEEQQTKKSEGGKQAIMMLNAYSLELSRCMASVEIPQKSSENEGLSSVLSLLDLSGCIVTQDAIGCYKDNVERLVEAKADYVIGLKKNQPTLYGLTEEVFKKVEPHSIEKQAQEKNKGRTEERTYKVLKINDLPDEFSELKELASSWENLNTIIKVESYRQENKNAEMTYEERYYISSLITDAQIFGKIIRGHWEVENRLHYVLDVFFYEDSGRKRKGNSAANCSCIRKMALNQLRKDDSNKLGIKRKRKKCARSEEYLDHIINL